MNITCDNVRTLLSSYLDGELSEDQAKTARVHLLDCTSCREAVQEGNVIRRWFAEPGEPVEIPQGFSARVARRAFAGDKGLLVPMASDEGSVSKKPASILPFVLKLSAAAAAILFVFSVLIQKETLPSGAEIQATDRSWMFDEVGPNALVEQERAEDLKEQGESAGPREEPAEEPLH